MARSFVLPLLRNGFFENAPREEPELLGMSTWTSLCFSRAFFARRSPSTARSSPSTHQNWASDIPMESCCKHATLPCWSFFILATILKVFHLKFIQCSRWTSCCFHVELLWRILVCNFLIHFVSVTQMIFFLYKPVSQYFFNFLQPRTWIYTNNIPTVLR